MLNMHLKKSCSSKRETHFKQNGFHRKKSDNLRKELVIYSSKLARRGAGNNCHNNFGSSAVSGSGSATLVKNTIFREEGKVKIILGSIIKDPARYPFAYCFLPLKYFFVFRSCHISSFSLPLLYFSFLTALTCVGGGGLLGINT